MHVSSKVVKLFKCIKEPIIKREQWRRDVGDEESPRRSVINAAAAAAKIDLHLGECANLKI